MSDKKTRTARRIAAASTGLFVAMAITGAGGLAEASAAAGHERTISATVPYSCSVAGLVTTTFNLTVTATTPASVTPGQSFSLNGVQVTTEIPANIVTLIISRLHIASFSGSISTFDFTASGGTPTSFNGAYGGLPFTIHFSSGQNASFTVPSSPESVGPFVAGHSGDVVISPGNIVITTAIGPITYAITCVPPSSLPAGATASIPIATSSSSSTSTTTTPGSSTSVPSSTSTSTSTASGTGSTGNTGTPPTTVPTSGHTGEPWAGWPYWALVALAGLAALISFGAAARLRRRST